MESARIVWNLGRGAWRAIPLEAGLRARRTYPHRPLGKIYEKVYAVRSLGNTKGASRPEATHLDLKYIFDVYEKESQRFRRFLNYDAKKNDF